MTRMLVTRCCSRPKAAVRPACPPPTISTSSAALAIGRRVRQDPRSRRIADEVEIAAQQQFEFGERLRQQRTLQRLELRGAASAPASCGMRAGSTWSFAEACSFPGPVHHAPLDQTKQQVQPIAERARGENSRVHRRHLEQLLRLEDAVAQARPSTR